MKNKNYPLYKFQTHRDLSTMIEVNAQQVGDRIAVKQHAQQLESEIESFTYLQLFEDIRREAAYIQATYGTNNHIAILGLNSYEWLIAFLGIICSNNIAVPTDKKLPAREVKELLELADVNIAFVTESYTGLVKDIEGIQYMYLRQLKSVKVENVESFTLYHPKDMNEVAAIFFTSGTTGKSKCVMLTHSNIIEEINSISQLVDPEGVDTLSGLPYNHTFGLNVAVLMAFNYQRTIFIVNRIRTVQKDIQESKPTTIMVVPLMIEIFYKTIMSYVNILGKEKELKWAIKMSNLLYWFGIDRRREIFKVVLEPFGGELKWIISGGAPLDPFYVKQFRNFGIEILNGYGTTECSPCVAVNRNYFHKDGSVGQLAPGMEARISEDGEIEIHGPVVMKGYYKNPEATAEVLSEDGWYKTGDLGYIDQDRFIFITGRKKNLIILSNGENISPEELESNFQVDEGVNEVLVYAWNGKIVAEIYPEEAYKGNEEYFENLRLKVNEGRPLSKQVASIKLREIEFIKNSTMKIVRNKNIPQE